MAADEPAPQSNALRQSLSATERFAALPEPVQGRVMDLVRVVIGSSQDEKEYAREVLSVMSVGSEAQEPVPELFTKLMGVVMAAYIYGRSTVRPSSRGHHG